MKNNFYITAAPFFSFLAIYDSEFDINIMLGLRIIAISVCLALLYSMFESKRWYLGLGTMVDESTGENVNMRFMKFPLAAVYVVALLIASMGGMLFGLKNTF